MKHYAFFAHFNRVNMQRGDTRVWSIHFRGTCYQVEGVTFHVPLRTRFRPESRQPRAVLIGRAVQVIIKDNQAEVF